MYAYLSRYIQHAMSDHAGRSLVIGCVALHALAAACVRPRARHINYRPHHARLVTGQRDTRRRLTYIARHVQVSTWVTRVSDLEVLRPFTQLLPSIMSISYMSSSASYAAIRHALNGNAWILMTAGLMYPQNVTTPITMHSMLTM